MRKLLLELMLTGAFIAAPKTLDNSDNYSINIYSYNSYNRIETITSALEKSGLKIYGENQKTLGTNFFEFYRLIYSDKLDQSNPAGFTDLEKKTEQELKKGVVLRDSLENKYDTLFETSCLKITDNRRWGRLIDGEQNISEKTFVKPGHEALDIFTQEGNKVLAPFNGIIVASGDGWQGKFDRKGDLLEWNNHGLMPAAGNAMIIYNPLEKGYMLISHMKDGLLVKTGDIITKGQALGYVGHTGSASIAGHGKHVHVAYKLEDHEGYLRGINFYKYLKK